jgi:hypothetical protein
MKISSIQMLQQSPATSCSSVLNLTLPPTTLVGADPPVE